MLIVIDAGHGGKDPGAIYQGIQEKDLNLEIAKALSKQIKAYGNKAILLREIDETISLTSRCQIANTLNADLFLSIHCNAFSDSEISGFEAHYYREGKDLAQTISNHVSNLNLMNVRSIKKSNFTVLKHTLMPAILLECGFMSNKFDLERLCHDFFRENLCMSITLALMAHYF